MRHGRKYVIHYVGIGIDHDSVLLCKIIKIST